jgi:hypothetical protein
MIQNEIENAISALFLSGEFKEKGIITVKSRNKELIFEQKINKKNKKLTTNKTSTKKEKSAKSV